MQRVNEQDPQLPAERTWGGNECCFACASFFIILSLMSGALFAYEYSVTHNVYYFIAMICSSLTLPASLYSAVHFARKDYNPRAVRPTGFVGPDHRRNQGFLRMRVVRPQDEQDDFDIESADSSEVHMEESTIPGPFLVLPVISILDVDLGPVQGTAAPEFAGAEEISSADTASESAQISEDVSLVDENAGNDAEQQANEQSGSRDSTPQSAEQLVVEEGTVRLRKSTPVFGSASPDN